MPTVAELTAGYGNFMLGPRSGPDVCDICFNFTHGYPRCYACSHGERWLDRVLPISYSVGGEQLHHVLRGYKRYTGEASRRLGLELAAVLWRFLERHEGCLARAVGIPGFDLVTTVPSGDPVRDRQEPHPLRRLVAEVVEPTRARHVPALVRSDVEVPERAFHLEKFRCVLDVAGRSVLLIDDTWTTGANAQSAAAALRAAGAQRVAAVVIGRHLNRDWRENDRRLRGMPLPYDWARCALCAGPSASRAGLDVKS